MAVAMPKQSAGNEQKKAEKLMIVPVPESKTAPKYSSQSDRTITVQVEGTDEKIGFAGKVHTTVTDIRDQLAAILRMDEEKLTLKSKCQTGLKILRLQEQAVSYMVVSGVKTLKKKAHEFEHPIVVVGAGLGGIMCILDLIDRGRTDVMIIDKHLDFGGHSWIEVPNKYTKLQTERGTYHTNYLSEPNEPIPKAVDMEFGSVPYPMWPSRDTLLSMMRENSRKHGLYEYAKFGCEIEKVAPIKNTNSYAIHWLPFRDEDGEGGLIMGGAVNAWPGFLHLPNTMEFPGEDDFGGYIEYSSFDKCDYTRAEGKNVMMYGHGAFSIENIRTLVEHKVKKCYLCCRYRNICGTKMTSWLVGYLPVPCPGPVMLDSLNQMYALDNYDLWKDSPSITTDKNRSFAFVKQSTIFGVTDVYFLAAYWGLMEVITDTVSRLSHRKVHLKQGRKLEDIDFIIKAIGTAPSFKVAKQLGIKEMVGTWVNGDAFRPCNISAKGVAAQNFSTYSIGPGLAPSAKMQNYFLDYPEELEPILPRLPSQKNGKWPAYVGDNSFLMNFNVIVSNMCPDLNNEITAVGWIKARKHQESLPLEVFFK